MALTCRRAPRRTVSRGTITLSTAAPNRGTAPTLAGNARNQGAAASTLAMTHSGTSRAGTRRLIIRHTADDVRERGSSRVQLDMPGRTDRFGVRSQDDAYAGEAHGLSAAGVEGHHHQALEATAQCSDVGQVRRIEHSGNDHKRGSAVGTTQPQQLTLQRTVLIGADAGEVVDQRGDDAKAGAAEGR